MPDALLAIFLAPSPDKQQSKVSANALPYNTHKQCNIQINLHVLPGKGPRNPHGCYNRRKVNASDASTMPPPTNFQATLIAFDSVQEFPPRVSEKSSWEIVRLPHHL